jgi:hypothetical protein
MKNLHIIEQRLEALFRTRPHLRAEYVAKRKAIRQAYEDELRVFLIDYHREIKTKYPLPKGRRLDKNEK